MAAWYIRCLREVQPAGPYSLGGWSMGGVVAFEMARQLEQQGETVDLLVLIDSFAPGGEGRQERVADGELVALFAYDVARLFGIDLLALPPHFEQLAAGDALSWLSVEAKRLGLLPPGLGSDELEQRFAVFQSNFRALERYSGGPCSAPLVLFKAAEPLTATARPDPDLGWGRLLQRPMQVHALPGDHYTLLQQPHVQSLAALLRERLGPTRPAGP
jgi:thioesterase domain-containing protein